MNQFYTYSKVVQWSVAIVLMLFMLVIFGIWLELFMVNFLLYFTFPLIAPVFQFCLTPFFTLIGMYQYKSPMLLAYGASKEKYDLHNGTGFDYWFVMRKVKSGIPTQNKILEYYLQGLLNIIKEIEEGIIPDTITISGTSYFFSESTAKRLGFDILPPSGFLKLNQYMNYIDLVWMYSRAKGKLTFPNLKNVKAAAIKGSTLQSNKDYLEKLYLYLKERSVYDKKHTKTI